MVISTNDDVTRRWARALLAAGWRVQRSSSIDALRRARLAGIDVAVCDAETPRDLRQLADLAPEPDLPPIVVRASSIAGTHALVGRWRGVLHVGRIDRFDVVASVEGLLSVAFAPNRVPFNRLPVSLPLVPATKWAVTVW